MATRRTTMVTSDIMSLVTMVARLVARAKLLNLLKQFTICITGRYPDSRKFLIPNSCLGCPNLPILSREHPRSPCPNHWYASMRHHFSGSAVGTQAPRLSTWPSRLVLIEDVEGCRVGSSSQADW